MCDRLVKKWSPIYVQIVTIKQKNGWEPDTSTWTFYFPIFYTRLRVCVCVCVFQTGYLLKGDNLQFTAPRSEDRDRSITFEKLGKTTMVHSLTEFIDQL